MDYKKHTIPKLIKMATRHFNKYIRNRDFELGCISCGGNVDHAGHFYNSKNFSSIRFHIHNVNGQCIHCNNYQHGNLIYYRRELQKKLGGSKLKKLDELADLSRKTPFKWDRATLIEIIETYKKLNKELE